MGEAFAPVLELQRSMGQEVDAATADGIATAATVGSLFEKVAVIATVSDAPKFKFVAPLERQYIRDDLGGLEGDVTVMGTLERKLSPGQSWSLLDVLGLGSLPRAVRRDAEQKLRKIKQLEGSVVKPPAAIIAPLAIYR